jgi:hypothetical protein
MAKALCSFSQTEKYAISNQEQPVLTHSCIKVTYYFYRRKLIDYAAETSERQIKRQVKLRCDRGINMWAKF